MIGGVLCCLKRTNIADFSLPITQTRMFVSVSIIFHQSNSAQQGHFSRKEPSLIPRPQRLKPYPKHHGFWASDLELEMISRRKSAAPHTSTLLRNFSCYHIKPQHQKIRKTDFKIIKLNGTNDLDLFPPQKKIEEIPQQKKNNMFSSPQKDPFHPFPSVNSKADLQGRRGIDEVLRSGKLKCPGKHFYRVDF